MTNDNSQHKCPGPDCTRQIPTRQYACRAHWRQIPRLARAVLDQDPGNTSAVAIAAKYMRP